MLEEEALDVQPTAEAGEGAVRPDHAVAGQDDGERVAPIRCAHRPGGVVAQSEPTGLLAVAHRLAVRESTRGRASSGG